MVALAFDDTVARQWLQGNQAADGSIALRAGSVIRDETPLGALALGPGPGRERALDHVVRYQGANGDDPLVNAFGWPWTDNTHGWTEPTAWGLLALRTLRPSATDRIADAIALFEERECVGGGWNYGTREHSSVSTSRRSCRPPRSRCWGSGISRPRSARAVLLGWRASGGMSRREG